MNLKNDNKQISEKSIKKIIKYILIFIILISIYCISLIITSLIPNDYMKEKTVETVEILSKEGNRAEIDFKIKQMYLDNYTTALMINNAYSMDNNNPLDSALLVRKNYIPGITEKVYQDTTKELVSASKYENLDQVGELKDTVNRDITESFEYARYWHGYLSILKPILIFFNLTQIRIISIIFLIIISVYLVKEIYQKINRKTAIFFLIALIFCEIFILGIELQGQINIYIALIASIIILKSEKLRSKNKYYYFFILGSITNFFDFFTIPMITYAIPIILLFKMENKEKTLKEIIIFILKTVIAWGLGYTFTWIAKWIIVDSIYHREIISKALEQVKYRGLNLKIGYLSTIGANIILFGTVQGSLLIILSIFNIIISLANLKEKKNNTIFYILISLIPFVWYFVVREHSYQHAFFTYRLLYINIIANLMIMSEYSLKKGQNPSQK